MTKDRHMTKDKGPTFDQAADPTWGDIFECCFKAQSSKLERLFSSKLGKRDVRVSSFELSKMSPQVGLGVHSIRIGCTFDQERCIFHH